jgi:hypothetical protein
MSEGERIVMYEGKIARKEHKCRELQKEIKMLRKLQHDKGNELVGLDMKEEYPQKINSLLEEIRAGKEREGELTERLELEEKQVKRNREHLKNLEENASELEEKYRKQVRLLGIIDRNGHGKQHQGERFMDHEQVDLLNKILKLESELQAKDKENKLLQMKIKESGYATMQ